MTRKQLQQGVKYFESQVQLHQRNLRDCEVHEVQQYSEYLQASRDFLELFRSELTK